MFIFFTISCRVFCFKRVNHTNFALVATVFEQINHTRMRIHHIVQTLNDF